VEKAGNPPRANTRVLTISPCVAIYVTNSGDGQASNSFSITQLDANGKPVTPPLVPERSGDASLNKQLPSETAARDVIVDSWFGSGRPFGAKAPMVSSSVHPSGPPETVVWFQDPGSTASIGPNAVPTLHLTT
jgi:hypothetical protein